MESFDNYRDTVSQYGASGLADDSVSLLSGYTSNTQNLSQALENLSLEGDKGTNGTNNNHAAEQARTQSDSRMLDDDFDGVLDDLKDDGGIDLPPHACR